MEFKGYKIEQENNKVIVEKVMDFDPVHVFDCGQCFRWIRQPDGSYTGVAYGRAVNVKYRDGVLELSNADIEDFKDIWFDYFDLGRDYSYIKEKVMKDEIMKEAVEFGSGIRLLKQNIWETLISFIISANNRIPRIMKTVNEISRFYGREVEMNGEKYYAFPSVEELSRAALEELERTGAGFRCKYIMNAAKMVYEGQISLEDVCSMDTVEARNHLMKFQGVGPKVADCTLLYSGAKYDVFPTDVWVKRVMEELYFKREASFGQIQEFARDYFGEYAGFAQQYLFYYARENKIGAK
ncbi:DNA-3-methyladenine glycosylase family protein [Acetivibrio straminisolvens]|jgi:N-glycosylase/DNA lyase|uniref:DNA-(apurinic or apyrimidinic site) lyase n=1 Tax=Acetivibrio straminisolvens JCM 21531 TaxID=1294263 RepID=W4V8A3_9FIRM|nr:DNA glycosylase [Acetivibrio straminisolvens]GAE89427.1 DNA glycosylase [Acetivibrio straminisolvens JCM 21531]